MNKATSILVCIIILPYVYSTYIVWNNELTNTFQYRSIAFLYNNENSSSLFPIEKNSYIYTLTGDVDIRPFNELIFLIISKISNIPIKSVQFITIGGIIFILEYFILCKKIFGDNILSLLLTIYLTFLILQDPLLITTYVHSWAIPIYLLIIFSFIKYLEQKDKCVQYFIVLLLLYVAVNYYYYTTEVWTMILILSMIIISKPLKEINPDNNYHKLWVIFIIFVIIFFSFNNILYGGFVSKMKDMDISKTTDSSIEKLLNVFQKDKINLEKSEKYVWNGVVTNYLHVYTNLAIFLIILFLCLSYTNNILRKLNQKHKEFDNIDILSISILIVGLIDFLGYMIMGYSLMLRSIFYFYPIVAFYGILRKRNCNKKIIILIMCTLVFLSSLNYYSSVNSSHVLKSLTYNDIEQPSKFLFLNIEKEFNLLSDYRTSGIFTVNGERYEKMYPVYYTDSVYSILLNKNDTNITDFVAINAKRINQPVESAWKFYEPISSHISEINDNTYLYKIYDDGKIWMFKYEHIIKRLGYRVR